MAYYVSIDPQGGAHLHWDRCKQRHREDGSRWYGPFTMIEEAREHAKGQADEECGCLKQRLEY